MIEKFGGRKFIFAILVTLLAFVFVLTGHLLIDAWLGFVATIGAIYVAGNVVSKFADK